jgi:hypothetical protein
MPTVEDTRIDEIGKIILDHRYEKDPRDMNALKYSSYLIAKKILEYMAPAIEKAEKYDALCLIKDPIQVEREYFQELVEKAEKWDKVKEIASYSKKEEFACPPDCPCDVCRSVDINFDCDIAKSLVDALEGGKSENKP